MLSSVYTKGALTPGPVLLCMGCGIALGALAALLYVKRSRCTRSFAMTLALLPLLSQTVILVVNGNLGAGLAVAGSFSLVRFRSAQGSAQEILAVFFSMALGLCLGAGYVGIACLLFLLFAGMTLLLDALHFGAAGEAERELRISVPEALEYGGLFDDLLTEHLDRWALVQVRTMEMGSVYQLIYRVTPPEGFASQPLLDAIRVRNGNLPVSLGRVPEERTL